MPQTCTCVDHTARSPPGGCTWLLKQAVPEGHRSSRVAPHYSFSQVPPCPFRGELLPAGGHSTIPIGPSTFHLGKSSLYK